MLMHVMSLFMHAKLYADACVLFLCMQNRYADACRVAILMHVLVDIADCM